MVWPNLAHATCHHLSSLLPWKLKQWSRGWSRAAMPLKTRRTSAKEGETRAGKISQYTQEYVLMGFTSTNCHPPKALCIFPKRWLRLTDVSRFIWAFPKQHRQSLCLFRGSRTQKTVPLWSYRFITGSPRLYRNTFKIKACNTKTEMKLSDLKASKYFTIK